MVCLRNISVDTLHKGDTEDNNNNVLAGELEGKRELGRRRREWESSVETGVKELDGRQWTVLIWLRMGTRGGLL
jgi:hypothetical protein